MGKSSSTKKVQRAARAGGKRRSTRQSGTSWGWMSAMAVVVIVGIVLIVISRNENLSKNGPGPHPRFGDLWHTAYGIDVCGKFLPDVESASAPSIGVFSNNDGLIHVNPKTTADTGNNATVGRWLEGQSNVKLTAKQIVVDKKAAKNGDKCGKTPAVVQVSVNGKTYTGDPHKIKLKDKQWITFAFLPKGSKIPAPPNYRAKLANAKEPAPPATTTTVPATTSTTTAGGSTTTTAPASTTTTAKK